MIDLTIMPAIAQRLRERGERCSNRTMTLVACALNNLGGSAHASDILRRESDLDARPTYCALRHLRMAGLASYIGRGTYLVNKSKRNAAHE